VDRQLDQNVVGGLLGIFDFAVEVIVFIEGSCIGQFELWIEAGATAIDFG